MSDIRTAAQREARANIGGVIARTWFAEGAAWGAARVTPTRDQLADEIAKHFRIGDEINGTYYCGCGEGDYRDANHVAEAILVLLAGLAEGESG